MSVAGNETCTHDFTPRGPYLARSFCPHTVRGTRRCRCSTCWHTCLRSGTSWLRNSSSVLHSLEVRKTVTLHGFSKKKKGSGWLTVSEFLCKKQTQTLQYFIYFFLIYFKSVKQNVDSKCFHELGKCHIHKDKSINGNSIQSLSCKSLGGKRKFGAHIWQPLLQTAR